MLTWEVMPHDESSDSYLFWSHILNDSVSSSNSDFLLSILPLMFDFDLSSDKESS